MKRDHQKVTVYTLCATHVNGIANGETSPGKPYHFGTHYDALMFAHNAIVNGEPCRITTTKIPKHIAQRLLCM